MKTTPEELIRRLQAIIDCPDRPETEKESARNLILKVRRRIVPLGNILPDFGKGEKPRLSFSRKFEPFIFQNFRGTVIDIKI